MQKKKRFQPASYKTAEGKPDGIVTKFKMLAKFTKVQINDEPQESGRMKALADSYRNITKWIESQDDGTKEKFKTTKNRVRAQAEAQVVREEKIFYDYYELFRLDRKTLSRKIVLRRKLVNFALKELEQDFLIEFIRSEAKKGIATDYSKAQKLIREYDELIYKTTQDGEKIESIEIIKKALSYEEYQDLMNQEHTIEEPSDEPTPPPPTPPPTLTKQEQHRKLLELADQISAEMNLRNKEKAQRSNLCFYLLYDAEEVLSDRHRKRVESEGKHSDIRQDDFDIKFTENLEGMKERIKSLSVTNLIEFIRIYCKAHNDFYFDNITIERNTNKMITNNDRKKKKTFTAEEKQGFVNLYKDEKITQKELAKQLGCSDRWIRTLLSA